MTNKVNNSLSSSPVYLQTCSVCKGVFWRTCDWLKHLSQDTHQKLARKQRLDKWNSKLRKCCLVVYTSERLTNGIAEDIVDYFTGTINGGSSIAMVTDFVWWEDRPQIGILQFDSREKAEHILKASGCQNSIKNLVGLHSQWIQVKNGRDLLELEWNAILPPISTVTSLSKRNNNHLSGSLTNRHDNCLAANANSLQDSKQIDNSAIPPTKRLRVTSHVENGMSDQSQVTEGTGLTLIKPLLVKNYDTSPSFHWTFTSHPLQFEYWNIRKIIHLPEPPKTKESLMEIQTCRLLEYLCQFDLRSHSLITLVTYWTTLNSINVAGKVDPDNLLQLPSHYTLKWLVIFFLGFRDHIPTPQQILDRNSDTNVLKDEATGKNIGFQCDSTYVKEWKLIKGTDKQLVNETSDEFLLSVLKLFCKFLVFCNTALGGNGNGPDKVVILQNGNVTSIEALLRPNSSKRKNIKRSTHWRKVMTVEEINTLIEAVKVEKESEDFSGIYMTHPFLFSHKISLARDIKDSFSRFSNGKLKRFLSTVEQVGVRDLLMEFGGLKKMLTIKRNSLNITDTKM